MSRAMIENRMDDATRSLATIARRLVRARLNGLALSAFPGELPATLEDAYAIQDAAIEEWPDATRGWKVGRIQEPWLARLGAERLVGPIFSRGVYEASGDKEIDFPVIPGGFAAVEAEFVVRLVRDVPAERARWTPEAAAELVDALHVGVEVAGSPLASINDLGPLAVVSDFGNNLGLIVGPRIDAWRELPPKRLSSETFVEGRSVGRGTAASVPGGPLAALAFALECCARRGLRLKAGDFVSTGATTGIHEIEPGMAATAAFAGVGQIHCRAVSGR
jgi:2-keto-4-pentenoate hydratase